MFQNYRKTTPTRARVLTEVDYATCGGLMKTNEGVTPFLPGDYVGKDALGLWPIPIEKVRSDYDRVGPVDNEGFVSFVSRDVRRAMQLKGPFAINGLTGKAGDYLVRNGKSAWIVDGELFERTYVLCDEEQSRGAN